MPALPTATLTHFSSQLSQRSSRAAQSIHSTLSCWKTPPAWAGSQPQQLCSFQAFLESSSSHSTSHSPLESPGRRCQAQSHTKVSTAPPAAPLCALCPSGTASPEDAHCGKSLGLVAPGRVGSWSAGTQLPCSYTQAQAMDNVLEPPRAEATLQAMHS